MKLFLTASGESMSHIIDTSFGRCNFFLLYETEDDNYEFFENQFQDEQSSVGAAVAQAAIDHGAQAVISVNPGPRAFKVLKEANLEVYHSPEGTKLKDVIVLFGKDELLPLESYLPHQS